MDAPGGRLPRFPYGAVYFRKSNPPAEDWPRDYRVAAEDGLNTFRHWFMWSAIEIGPGVFDWAAYDRQLDLAAEVGISTVIAEFVTAAPEWAWRRLAHARYVDRDGRPAHSQLSHSSATGGFPGLCLDNEDARGHAEAFLRGLVERYRDHPATGAYDVWNECNIPAAYCYCPATIGRFRDWLRARYGDLRTLGRAWGRYSFAEWADVEPPRLLAPYPEVVDWLQFRIDNAYRLLRWRADLIRALDPAHPVAAHGVGLTLSNLADTACDEWRAAAEVDAYGFTWVAARRGNEPWKQWHAVDLVRAGSRGKPFWHAEAQAGPLWMQPQVIGRPLEDGRVAEPEDIRLWTLTSFAGGARGWLCPRWRPLLDGPLFGAFGAYGMDGARTPRSEMVSRLARWATAPEQADLWDARPARGEIGIIVAPESQLFCYAQQGSTDVYARSARGAYQGFLDAGYQPDWVHLDHLDEYDALYLPFPAGLSERTAGRLIVWVAQGGVLISEGCPACFGDRGHVAPAQPAFGLDALFGAREALAEFAPDLLDGLLFRLDELAVPGGIFRQAYAPTRGTPVGWYVDRQVAVVDSAHGRGRTRLIGTFPGYGHDRRPDADSRAFFARLGQWAGLTPQAKLISPASDGPRTLVARLQIGAGRTFLWLVNHARAPVTATVELGAAYGPFRAGRARWGAAPAAVNTRQITVTVDGRDAAVVELLP